MERALTQADVSKAAKKNKSAPSRGCGRSAPLDIVATRCLRLKLFYFAAYAAAQTECRRQPPRFFARFAFFQPLADYINSLTMSQGFLPP